VEDFLKGAFSWVVMGFAVAVILTYMRVKKEKARR